MPTLYNIRMTAEHPLKMGLAPDSKSLLESVERLLREHGMQPIVGSSERADGGTGEHEIATIVRNAPGVLLLAIAKLFEGELAQRMDPDSDLYDPKFCTGEPWVEIVDLAKSILDRRESARQDGSLYMKEVKET